MKTSRRLPYALFILLVLLLSNSKATAQRKPVLPGDLKSDSSVAEILTWLDQTTFRNARIVLKDSWYDEVIYPWDDTEAAKNTFIFTQGFRVTNIDGCNLMLRNGDARTIAKSKLGDPTRVLVVDVWVQLNRMSPTRGRATHRYTKDPEKARLLGAWRTDFKYSGWSSRTIVGMTLRSTESKEPARWEGMDLAFIFDTEEMSKNFDAAFRQAIRLCKSK